MTVHRSALFNASRNSRYWLRRVLENGGEEQQTTHKTRVFVGVNPSEADENNDDATVRRLVNCSFKNNNNYNRLLVINLCALVSTKPFSRLPTTDARNIQEISRALQEELDLQQAVEVIYGWGNNGPATPPLWLTEVLRSLKIPPPLCFGRTDRQGKPRHPCRLSNSVIEHPVPF